MIPIGGKRTNGRNIGRKSHGPMVGLKPRHAQPGMRYAM